MDDSELDGIGTLGRVVVTSGSNGTTISRDGELERTEVLISNNTRITIRADDSGNVERVIKL